MISLQALRLALSVALLFAAFVALVWSGAALGYFGYRSVRYRSEAPR